MLDTCPRNVSENSHVMNFDLYIIPSPTHKRILKPKDITLNTCLLTNATHKSRSASHTCATILFHPTCSSLQLLYTTPWSVAVAFSKAAMRLLGRRDPRPPRPPSPPTRSMEMPRYTTTAERWSELSSQARTGLSVASEEEPTASNDSISIDGVRYITPPGSDVPSCWVRAASDSAGSVPSAGPSPATQLRRVTPHNSPTLTADGTFASPSQTLKERWDYAELTALKERFQALDAEGKGFLSRSQFNDLFSSIVEHSDSESSNSPMLNFAYSLFYSSGESLNLKEFVTGMTIVGKGNEDERLRYLFLMYDSDASGYLNAEEIKQIFRVMSSYAQSQHFAASESLEGQSLSSLRRGNSENLEELALKALTEQDMDGDGKIGFEDFESWCHKDPVVKTWLDKVCHDARRGIERLKQEREQALIARELDSLGFADNSFWRSSFNLNSAAATPSNSGILPPTIANTGGSAAKEQPAESTSSTSSQDIQRSNSSRHSRSLTQHSVGTFEIEFKNIEFRRQIGSGSFATVWECSWLGSPVAVKVFKSGPRLIINPDGSATAGEPVGNVKKFSEDGESFEPDFDSMAGATNDINSSSPQADTEMGTHRIRFLQEVALLKSIRHPNLLLYMGACVDARYPLCIVSELIDGGSLYELLHGAKKIRLDLRQKVMLTQDIARGMRYLHGREPIVLHRDLKSANILVEEQNDDSFKGTIIDFGLSKLSSTQQSLVPGGGRGLTGSLVTMAPEVMNEQQYVPRSDVYSFGIVTWEIFCGRIPFGKFTQVAQLLMKVAVRGERPTFKAEDEVPISVQNMIRACWDQDVQKRPDFLEILKMLDDIGDELKLGVS